MTTTNPWQGRGRWLAVVAVAVLAFGLLLVRLAVPGAADPIGPGQSADELMQEFENLCTTKGGNLDVTQTEDGSIHMSCTLPTYTAYCSFLFDGDEFYDIECWDLGAAPAPGAGGQVGTYFPAPTPANGPAGVGNRPVISGVNAPPENGPAPTVTPTPMRPGGSVLGGIVATIGPAKLPPEPTRPPAGNRSGISLILRVCPPTLPKLPQQFGDCSVNQSVNNQVTFLVGGPGVQEVTVHGGGLNLSGLPAGKYLIRMNIPTGYDNPVGYCSFAPSEDQAPVPSQKVPIGNGSYTFELGQDQTIYCNWYITLDLSRAPAKMAGATPMVAASSSPATTPLIGSQPPGANTQTPGAPSGNPASGQLAPTASPGTPVPVS